YVILAALLVVTRVIDGVNEFLTTPGVTQLNLTSILGVEGIDTDVQFFFSPGFILIVSALLGYVIYQMPAKQIAQTWKTACKLILGIAVALPFDGPVVRLSIRSCIHGLGLESNPVVFGEGVASVAGPAWSFFAPFIGALGAFVAGSNTVSNLTFSQFQWST